MLTTLRQTAEGWFIDLTVTDSGATDMSVGPLNSQHHALRCERHILREHLVWTEMVQSAHPSLISSCMSNMVIACMVPTDAFHDTWMRHHPLQGARVSHLHLEEPANERP